MKNLFAFYFLLWLGYSVWMVSDLFIDSETTPKWYAAFGGAAIGTWIWFFCHTRRTRISFFHPTKGAFAILLCGVSQAIYGIWQWSISSVSGISGSFDNPAGLSSFLVFSIPFGYYGATRLRKQWMALTGTAVLCIAILLTESRTGILCTIILLFLHIRRYMTRYRKKFILVFSVLFAIISVTLYDYKKDSANGRMLIWRCTLEMICDNPWLGYGHNGFRSNYMNRQAEYFQHHPDSRYAMLADDVKHPFNEYLYLLTHYGLWGGFVLMAFAVWSVRAWQKHPDGSSRPAMLCLVVIAVFSMFSYPFRYPHTWILCIYSVIILSCNAWKIHHKTQTRLLFLLALCLSSLAFQVLKRILAEIQWRQVADSSLCGMTEEMLPVYKDLYKDLRDDPLFLYNYAAELNVAGQYEKSLRIGKECENLLADYFTQLLLADNCKHLKKYKEAIRHLAQASYMCPNRFVPLYELYEIHKIQRDSIAMHGIGQTILTKPIKIDSPEIQRIIHKVNKDFKESCK